jgi:predicted extracellular nuclease
MTIGSLNMFRFFDDINDPPDGTRDDDGAHADYASRRAKFALYILDVLEAPDVVGVQEAEKIEVLQSLAASISALDPSVAYTAYLIEGNDIGQIDSGFLVRDTVTVDAVTQLGKDEVHTWDGFLLHDRPPLLLEGRYTGNGADFPVAVISIHNRSLSGIEGSGTGPRIRQKRLEQAESVANMIQAFQTASPSTPLVLVGDFNAFEFTDGFVDAVGHIKGLFDPSEELICQPGQGTAGGTNACPDLVNPDFADLVLDLPAAERFSYNFGGSAQVLDHALTSQSTNPWLRDFQLGRGNSDAPAVHINDSSTPRRSSDHDGFAVYLMTDGDADSVPDDLDVCPGTTIPEPAPSGGLKANHWVLANGDGVFDTTGNGNGGPFTIAQTGGCSCTQIVDGLGLGNGQRKHGCSKGTMEDWIELVNP